MPRPSLRESLLDAGLDVMFRKGYIGSGVREIAAAAGAPQGSFTNHFRSKEAFAGEVLDRYFENLQTVVSEALEDRSVPPRERLRRYLDLITERLEADRFARGCLIGDFSLEAVGHSDALRDRLVKIFEEWREPFAACIAEGQAGGDLSGEFDAHELADFLLSAWEGAILRMKVERSREPLERFKAIVFATVFREDS